MVQNTESFHFDLRLPSVQKSFRFTAGTETAMPSANIDEHKGQSDSMLHWNDIIRTAAREKRVKHAGKLHLRHFIFLPLKAIDLHHEVKRHQEERRQRPQWERRHVTLWWQSETLSDVFLSWIYRELTHYQEHQANNRILRWLWI